MSKTVKCRECNQSTCFAIPSTKYLLSLGESDLNYYRKMCCEYFVCDHTMKTKRMDHKQQCKHFVPEDEFHKREINSASKVFENALKGE